LRDQAVAGLDEFIQAIIDVRAELDVVQAVADQNMRYLRDDRRAVDVAAMSDIPVVRSTLTERLNRLEHARMASRRSFWRLHLAEGTTIADVARSWGLSRQLVSRALSERATDVSR
jgi:hypothetical protein